MARELEKEGGKQGKGPKESWWESKRQRLREKARRDWESLACLALDGLMANNLG